MIKDGKKYYTSTQLAEMMGVNRITLLRMEDIGLISHSFREGNGNSRYYDEHTAAVVEKILELQQMGFNRREIRSILVMHGILDGSEEEKSSAEKYHIEKMIKAKIEDMEGKLELLKKLLKEIKDK